MWTPPKHGGDVVTHRANADDVPAIDEFRLRVGPPRAIARATLVVANYDHVAIHSIPAPLAILTVEAAGRGVIPSRLGASLDAAAPAGFGAIALLRLPPLALIGLKPSWGRS